MTKPILCLDFDGVIHSYKSGWKGARVIPDPPVPGALEFVVTALDRFNVAIFSSRSHYWDGRRAMKNWLRNELVYQDPVPEWWLDRVARTGFADIWSFEVAHAANLVLKEISWPLFKPPAFLTIDDRALTFDGTWPSLDSLATFKPWHAK